MSISQFTPTGVVHQISVDIGNVRYIPQVVKLTQGDNSLPVIAIKLTNGGQPYTVPDDATDVRFIFGKPDGNLYAASAQGVDSTGQIAYFLAEQQTCAAAGRGKAIVQVLVDDQIAGTGSFYVDVTENPQSSAVPSDTEIGYFDTAVQQATQAATTATQQATAAGNSATQAAASQSAAAQSATSASTSATAAQQSAYNAEQAATNAAQQAAEQFEDSITALETAKGENLNVDDSAADQLYGLQIYGKATQDGTPSTETQVPIDVSGSDGSVEINFTGANLFDASKIPTSSAGGATVTNNGDGSFTVSGSGTTNIEYRNLVVYNKDDLKIDEGVIQVVKSNVAPFYVIQFYDANGTPFLTLRSTDENNSIQVTKESLDKCKMIAIGFYAPQGKEIVPGTVKPMLYQYGDGTWEPFKEPQQLSISTPNGLPGIPVESGGNYTDENGQQYISDVIDCEAKTKTQNVGVYESYNGKTINTSYLSTTGQLTTGATVYYVLDDPIVTDLSAEEIAAYKALMTYEGTTNVFSDTTPEVGISMQYRNNRTLSDNIAQIADSRAFATGYRPNLFTNGDFQVNQRGQSSYTFTGSGVQYFLDMWAVMNSTDTVTVNEDGGFTSQSGCNPYQIVNLEDGKQYMLSANIGGVIYYLPFTAGTPVSNDRFSVQSYASGGYQITLTVKAGETALWAYLTKGNILFKHVKENYSCSLMKCQRFVYVINAGSADLPIAYGYGESQTGVNAVIDLPKMESTPTIVYTASDFRLWQSQGVDVSAISISNYSNGKAWLSILPDGNAVVSYPYLLSLLSGKSVTFSCEPL